MEPQFPASSSNPYAAPLSEVGTETESASLGELVRGWEKSRLLYNGILLLPGIGTLAIPVMRGILPIPAGLLIAITLGLGANAAFFLGPLAELYFRGLFLGGKPAPLLRRLLLIGGLLVSFGAMAVFLIGSFIPNPFAPQ